MRGTEKLIFIRGEWGSFGLFNRVSDQLKTARRFLSRKRWLLAAEKVDGIKKSPLRKYAAKCKRILRAEVAS